MTNVQESGARFIKAFNAHDEDGMRALTHPNATFTAPGDVQLRGVEATGYATQWLRACPDGRLTIVNELVSGQAGTLSATGKKLAIKAVMITRYESDLALETRLYFDQVAVLNQLGAAMPALAAAAV